MTYNPQIVETLRKLNSFEMTLNDYIKAYYDAEVLPFPSELKTTINQVIDKVMVICKDAENDTDHPFFYHRSKRINEFGNHLEDVVCEAIKQITGNEADNLGTGYPDVRTQIQEWNIYPECKTTQDIDEHTTMRTFYTSLPSERTKKRKNIKDGVHLLFTFEHDGDSNHSQGRGLTGRYTIRDLCGFKYYMVVKQEGNGVDIAKCPIILAD